VEKVYREMTGQGFPAAGAQRAASHFHARAHGLILASHVHA
jgi:hypothetical protein